MRALNISVFAAIITYPAFSQWEWQNPLPSVNSYPCYAVVFPTIPTGYAAGVGGTILKTKDARLTWERLTHGNYYILNSVIFPVTNTGYVAGDFGTIMKTTDEGKNWFTIHSGISVTKRFIFFTYPLTGFAVGDLGSVIKTTDGGKNWIFLYCGTTQTLFSVCFIDADHGYTVGSSTILRTMNGGISWEMTLLTQDKNLLTVFFTDPHYSYVVGPSSFIINANDGGQNWKELSCPVPYDFHCVWFTDNNLGIFVDGDIYFKIQNLDNGYEATLYYPGTIQILQPLAIGDRTSDPSGFNVFQNIINCAADHVPVKVYQPLMGQVSAMVTELNGQQGSSFNVELDWGFMCLILPHEFSMFIFFRPGKNIARNIVVVSGTKSSKWHKSLITSIAFIYFIII